MSRFPLLNTLLNLNGNDLISKPIKELRQHLKANCEYYGVYNAKELSKLLSKERRREKKVIYSFQERKRLDNTFKNNEEDLSELKEIASTLQEEKTTLLEEIAFYQNEIDQICDPGLKLEYLLSEDILQMLDYTYPQ